MSEIQLHQLVKVSDMLRSYKKQAFGYDIIFPQFEDIYTDCLELLLVQDNQLASIRPASVAQNTFSKALLLNALLEQNVSFIFDQRLLNPPIKAVW